MNGPLLAVEDLKVHFPIKVNALEAAGGFAERALRRMSGRTPRDVHHRPVVHAVDGISFQIDRGEILGLVGESGCGKTTTGRAVLRLVRPTAGRILFEGRDITDLKEAELRPLRPRIQIIFQDPHAALNPTMTIGRSIMDPLLIHGDVTEEEAREAAMRVLEEVGLSPPGDFFDKFPADLSGGQKQRAVIGRAIILKPSLIVADEPVAMLDMSVRARILELLLDLRRRYGLSFLLITHDLATAKFMCDRIAIMYLGRVVETGAAEGIYRDPKHPYTKALIAAIPAPEPGRQRREITLPRGEVPDAISPPAGCRFHPRCPVALPTCGWEGRDFVAHLEERRVNPSSAHADERLLGRVEEWEGQGLIAKRLPPPQDAFTLLAMLWFACSGAVAILCAVQIHALKAFGQVPFGQGLSIPLAGLGIGLSIASAGIALALAPLKPWTRIASTDLAVANFLWSLFVALQPSPGALRAMMAAVLFLNAAIVYALTRPAAGLALSGNRQARWVTREGAKEILAHLDRVRANAPDAMARAMGRFRVFSNSIAVEFRPPEALELKRSEDRLVECLLY